MAVEGFARYEILQPIMGSGLAQAFRARAFPRSGPPKVVVLRKLPEDLARSLELRMLFTEEARLCAQLDHPNITRILDFGVLDDEPFVVADLPVGGSSLEETLDALSRTRRQLPLDATLFVTAEILAGLLHAHRRTDPDSGRPAPVLHRNLSPSAVFLGSDGSVTLRDFAPTNFSRLEQTLLAVIRPGSICVSPEQVAGVPVDARTDVYAAGMILYRLLAGYDPGSGRRRTVVRNAQGDLPALSTVDPRLPLALDRVVGLATKLFPGMRLPTAEMLARLIEVANATEARLRKESVQDVVRGVLAEKKASEPQEVPSIVFRIDALISETMTSDHWERSFNSEHGAQRLPKLRLGIKAAGSPADPPPAATGGVIERSRPPADPGPIAEEDAVTTANMTPSFFGVGPVTPPSADRALRRARARLSGHSGDVAALALLANGSLASGALDGVRLWDVERGQETGAPKGLSSVTALASADGFLLAVGGTDGSLTYVRTDGDRPHVRVAAHRKPVASIALVPDGGTAITGSTSGELVVWDVLDTSDVAPLEGHSAEVRGAAFLGGAGIAVTGARDRTLRIWNVLDATEIRSQRREVPSLESIAVSPAARLAAVGTEDGSVLVFDLERLQPPSVLLATERGSVRALAFSPDGHWLASGASDGSLRVWDVKGGRLTSDFEPVEGPVNALALDQEGRLLLAACGPTIRVFER